MIHFTYAAEKKTDLLTQGDVIQKSEELSRIIKEIHPFFYGDAYNYFLVLTQSCDLIRRGKKCGSPYITLAAVRPLDEAVRRESAQILDHNIERKTKQILEERKKGYIENFITKIHNNNFPEYFYLHPEVNSGFPEPSVAFLRVTIALKSDLHYDVCLSSKILELRDDFKARLGWMVGHLYSRVGTEDWDSKVLRKITDEIIRINFNFVPSIKELDKELKAAFPDNYADLSREQMMEFFKQFTPLLPRDKVLRYLKEKIANSGYLKDTVNVDTLINEIREDEDFKELIK